VTRLDDLFADPWFPFTGDIRVKDLEPPQIPEPARAGETAQGCRGCERKDADFVWCNQDWALQADRESSFPGVVLLVTRAHYDSFADLPDHLLVELGPMTARVERAVLSMGDVARVHVLRWGDGSGHFHLWFMPRPLGAMQLRGSMFPMWLDLLEPLPTEAIDAALATIASAMRAGD
jgi:diadenosine tetraphosphate (Ap4A) HIT family hydrolase